MSRQELLALRPTPVQRRFGTHSTSLVLSGAVLVRAAVDAAVAVCSVEVVRLELLPGVLRAAEELDVALQLCVDTDWSASRDEGAPARLTSALVRQADAARYSGPLVLSAVIDGAVAGADLEEAAGQVLTLIEAGFTSFQFPMPGRRSELAATRALMGLVQEYGLGVEVIDVPAGGIELALEVFHRSGVALHAVAEVEDARARLVAGGGVVPVALAHKLGLSSAPFIAIVARHLDVDPEEAWFAPIDAFACERIEAVAYAEARRAMRSAQLIGGASSCLASLAGHE